MARSDAEWEAFVDGQIAVLKAGEDIVRGRVDPARAALDAQARALQKAEPGLSYFEAIMKVRERV
jgi:hypothetical protein